MAFLFCDVVVVGFALLVVVVRRIDLDVDFLVVFFCSGFSVDFVTTVVALLFVLSFVVVVAAVEVV